MCDDGCSSTPASQTHCIQKEPISLSILCPHCVIQSTAGFSESGVKPALQQLQGNTGQCSAHQNIRMTPESPCAAAWGPPCLEIEVRMDGCRRSHLGLFFYRRGLNSDSGPHRN